MDQLIFWLMNGIVLFVITILVFSAGVMVFLAFRPWLDWFRQNRKPESLPAPMPPEDELRVARMSQAMARCDDTHEAEPSQAEHEVIRLRAVNAVLSQHIEQQRFLISTLKMRLSSSSQRSRL